MTSGSNPEGHYSMDRQRSAFAHSTYEPAALVLVDAVDADGSDNSKLHCKVFTVQFKF
jgi:hypothetical protein